MAGYNFYSLPNDFDMNQCSLCESANIYTLFDCSIKLPDSQYNGESQTAERTAAFDPIRRIENLDTGIVLARLQHCRESSYILLHEELPDCCSLGLFQRPKGVAEWNAWLAIPDTLFGKVLPGSTNCVPQRYAHRLGALCALDAPPRKAAFITHDHLLKDLGCGNSGKVRSPRRWRVDPLISKSFRKMRQTEYPCGSS